MGGMIDNLLIPFLAGFLQKMITNIIINQLYTKNILYSFQKFVKI